MNVLDSSVVVALILGEPIPEDAISFFSDAAISAVNYAETIAVLERRGFMADAVDAVITQTELQIIPFDAVQAKQAGQLIQQTRQWGLSLGDCACLALAQTTGGTAITTDRAWSECGMADVLVIR